MSAPGTNQTPNPRANRIAYRFMGRCGEQYVWQSTQRMLGDSRVEEIRCNVAWFWAGGQR